MDKSTQETTVTATTTATATSPPQPQPPTTVSMNTSNTTSSSNDPSTFVTSTTNPNSSTNRSFTDSVASTEGRRMHTESLSKTNLYIRALPASTTDQDLYDMCSRFGNIFSTKAILDKVNGGCRGYGFVQFSSPQSADLAVQELTKSGIQAQMARISPGNSSHNHHHSHNNQYQYQNNHNTHHNHQNTNNNYSSSNNPNSLQHNNNSSKTINHNNSADPTNLYIANLPLNMNEQELENLLMAFGPVVSTRILRDQINNSPRGVGFARMESRDKCQEIIDKLNGKPFKGLVEPLLVKFADGGNKKRQHYNNHHNNSHHQHHHKINQDDNRWRENSNNVNDLDLAIMSTLSYPRIQPGFPPSIPGPAYPSTMGPTTSGAPQWIHPVPGQSWNMIPQQMIQPGLNPPNQAAGFPFGHISQLTSQMQGLQIAHHPVAPVGGYLPAHHQWSPMWSHPMPPQQQQPQPQGPSVRLAGQMPQQQPPQPQQQQPQQQHPPQQHRPPPQHQAPSHTSAQHMTGAKPDPPILAKQQHTVATESKLQVTSAL